MLEKETEAELRLHFQWDTENNNVSEKAPQYSLD